MLGLCDVRLLELQDERWQPGVSRFPIRPAAGGCLPVWPTACGSALHSLKAVFSNKMSHCAGVQTSCEGSALVK